MEYAIIFLTLCIMEGTVWLFLWCTFYSEMKGNRGCRVVTERGWGVDKSSVSLRFSAMWQGRKKKGRKVLAVGESLGERDLSGVLSQAKNPYVSLQIDLLFPQSFLLKVLLPQPWAKDGLRSACLICRVDGVDLNVPLKFITGMEVLKIHIFITGDLFD